MIQDKNRIYDGFVTLESGLPPAVLPPTTPESFMPGAPDTTIPPGGLTGTVPSENPFGNFPGLDITTGVSPTGLQYPGNNYSPAPDGGYYVYDTNWNYVGQVPGQTEGAPASTTPTSSNTPTTPVAPSQDVSPPSPYDLPSNIGNLSDRPAGSVGAMPFGTGGLGTIGNMFDTGGTSSGGTFGGGITLGPGASPFGGSLTFGGSDGTGGSVENVSKRDAEAEEYANYINYGYRMPWLTDQILAAVAAGTYRTGLKGNKGPTKY
jgi:hypothetical protein